MPEGNFLAPKGRKAGGNGTKVAKEGMEQRLQSAILLEASNTQTQTVWPAEDLKIF